MSSSVTCCDCGLVEDRRSSTHKRCRDCAAAWNNERNIASYHANPRAHRSRIERSRRLMVKGARKDPWTEEEDLEVMRNDITTREIAILLDRDEAAIQSRRSQLRTKARNGALRRVCKGCGEAEVPHRNALCAGCKADGERKSARRRDLRAYYVKKVASDIRVDDYGFAYKASTCLLCGGVAISRGVKARKFCSKPCSRRGAAHAGQPR